MSKYLLDKFLFTVDRDPALVERYRADPAGTVAWWERERANQLLNSVAAEASTWLRFTDAERDALVRHDHVALFEMGAHPFLTLTLWIAMFEPRLRRATGHAARLRREAGPRHAALPGHQHLSDGVDLTDADQPARHSQRGDRDEPRRDPGRQRRPADRLPQRDCAHDGLEPA